ncbi:MAG: DUF4368 domain-containing protein [Acutalibacteraceae bacterium]|nr:DUF4368 domain-containing protein [Acutalibacteraceae bacterium]
MKSDTGSEIISFCLFLICIYVFKNRFTASEAVFLSLFGAITAPLIYKLIDHIDVYEAEGKGKNKTQRVVIHYNFVGYLEIPESGEPYFTADTRQRVAIGYIAKPTEKSA